MLAQKYEAFEEKFENEEAQKRYLVQKRRQTIACLNPKISTSKLSYN